MTPKIPSSFDGQSSWFGFEDLIDDWVSITTLSAEKLGSSLKKNALTETQSYVLQGDVAAILCQRSKSCFSLAFHAAL